MTREIQNLRLESKRVRQELRHAELLIQSRQREMTALEIDMRK